MPATDNERAIPFANNTSALCLAFLLSFNPIFAGTIAGTDCAGVSARADNRHGRRHHGNFEERAN